MSVATGRPPASAVEARCRRHAGRPAARQCTSCGRAFCDPCLREKVEGRVHIESCPDCGGFCRSLEPAGPRPPGSMAEILGDAFAYPLNLHGLVVILLGAVFYTILSHLRSMGVYRFVVGPLFFALGTGYLSAFLFQVVTATVAGERRLPQWPDFTDLWESAIIPLAQMLAPSLVCLVPGAVPFLFLGWTPEGLVTAVIVAVAASFYVPMALLAIALNNSVAAMHPAVVLPAIRAIPGPYLVTWIVIGCLEGLSWTIHLLITMKIPLLGFGIQAAVSLFLLTVEMRLLGLLYLAHGKRMRLV